MHSPVHTRYSSLINSTVNVNLSVLAYPRPEHKWTSNTTGVVKERPTVVINSYSYKYEGTVTIRRATDFGEYCLQLTNIKGSSQLCLQIQEGGNNDIIYVYRIKSYVTPYKSKSNDK